MTATEDERLRSILDRKIVAVVGLSKDPAKPSYRVSSYLKSQGYCIVPVNPTADNVLGEKSYKSLLDLPEELQRQIEVVDIFRPSNDVPPLVEQAIQLKQKYGKLKAVWMQLGITNERAAALAKNAGLEVVMDKCMMVEHRRLKR